MRLKQNSLAIKMANILTNNYSTNKLIFNNLSLDYCAKTLERERERERELTSKHASNKNISGGIFRFFFGLRFKDTQTFITEYSPINTSIVVSVNTFVSPIYFVVVISDQHESSVYLCHNYVRQQRVAITRSCYLSLHFQATNIN